MTSSSLAVASMRRVLELYYFTAEETRIEFPPFVPSAVDPDVYAQIAKKRLLFTLQQGLLSLLHPNGPLDDSSPLVTFFGPASRRLESMMAFVTAQLSTFVRYVTMKRQQEEDDLNKRLQEETAQKHPGWRCKRQRRHTLNDRDNERLRVQLNVEETAEVPIYLLVQVDRNYPEPIEKDGVLLQMAIVFGNMTFNDAVEYVQVGVRQRTIPSSAYYLVWYSLSEYYIDMLVLPSIIRAVVASNGFQRGVDLELLNQIMRPLLENLITYETMWQAVRTSIEMGLTLLTSRHCYYNVYATQQFDYYTVTQVVQGLHTEKFLTTDSDMTALFEPWMMNYMASVAYWTAATQHPVTGNLFQIDDQQNAYDRLQQLYRRLDIRLDRTTHTMDMQVSNALFKKWSQL